MYKFNFLSKINQEKLEAKKRDQLIRLIFFVSSSIAFILIVLLYFIGLGIKADYKIAQENKNEIESKIKKFRNEGFFKYKLSENLYNSMQNRKKITDILQAVEYSMDSTVIINDLVYDKEQMVVNFIIRSSGSKSHIMSWVVNFKDQVNEKLTTMNFADEKHVLTLTKGPDLRKSMSEFSYWNFILSLEFPKIGKKK